MQVLKLQTGVEGREGGAFTINKGVLVNATNSPSPPLIGSLSAFI